MKRWHKMAMASLLLLHGMLLLGLLYALPGQMLDVEERFIAFVARSFQGGPPTHWTLYTYTNYEHGTLMVGLLTCASFKLFGPTLLSLKLVSIGISIVTVGLAAWLGAEYFGWPTGLLAGLLLALGPPSLLLRGIQTLGDTSEVLPWVLLQFIVAHRLQVSEKQRHRLWLATLLGLVSGLGLTFSYAMLPATGAVLVCWWLGRKPGGRERLPLKIFSLCCLLGFALPLWNNLQHGIPLFQLRGGIDVHRSVASPADWARSFRGLFGEQGFLGFHHELHLRGWPSWSGAAYQFILLVSLIATSWIGWRARRLSVDRSPPELRLALLHTAYLAAYLLTRVQSYYLLILLAPTGALMLARLLGPLVARGPVRRVLCGISLGAVIALQVVPLWPARETLSSDPMLDIRPGGDDRWLWRFRNWKHPQIENHRPLPKEQIGIGWWFAATGQDERLARLLHVWGEADPLAHGFGYGVGWRFREGPRERLARCLAVPCPLRQAVIRGFGTSLAERFIWDQEPAQLLKSVPVELRQAYLEGYGYGLGWRYWHNPLRFEPILEDFPADAQQHLRHGLKQRYDVLTDMEW